MLIPLTRLMVRNAFRNKARTLLTIGSVAVFLVAFVVLLTIITSFQRDLDRWGKSLRVVVHAASSLGEQLPARYGETLRGLEKDGVTCVCKFTWFGAVIPGRERDFFANLAADYDTVRTMFEDAVMTDDVYAKMRADPAAAVAGAKLTRKMGWQIGDRITLQSPIYGITTQVTLVGTYAGPDETSLFFSHALFDNALEAQTGRTGVVGTFWLKMRSADLIGPMCRKIDQEVFKDGPVETKTETEKAFNAFFISMLGNLANVVRVVGLVICFVLALVSANTMAMAARERVREVAVLKTLGFRPWHVLVLFVGEALLVTGAGGLLGTCGTALYLRARDLTESTSMLAAFTTTFQVAPSTIAIGMGISLVVGLVASGAPAISAARLKIVDGLRKVV